MTKCKPVATPMAVTEKLSMSDGEALGVTDASRYQSIVGALQYLTLTRPHIAFIINKVYQFLHSPTTSHWTVKRMCA